MAYFEPAFNYLMSHEDPGLTGKVTSDSGGLTRWGISQHSYPNLDIRNLTLDEAAEICRRDFFSPMRGWQIGDQRIASKLLDMAYNMGLKTAVMILQSALNTWCQPRPALLKEDGVLGPATLIAVNNADTTLLLTGLADLSKKHYQHIAQARRDEAKDLKGWLARAAALPPECPSATSATA